MFDLECTCVIHVNHSTTLLTESVNTEKMLIKDVEEKSTKKCELDRERQPPCSQMCLRETKEET